MKSFDVEGTQSPGPTNLVRPIHVTGEAELEFQSAVEAYKNRSGRNFPTWSEILELIVSLGYSKRIWQPVGIWSAIPTESLVDERSAESSLGVMGWFSSVETPVGP